MSSVYGDKIQQHGNSAHESTVRSIKDGFLKREILLGTTDNVIPSSCSYSTTLDGFPCLHGISILCHSFGSSKLHHFIFLRHLTSHWIAMYSNVLFYLLSQADIDRVISNEKKCLKVQICTIQKLHHLLVVGL